MAQLDINGNEANNNNMEGGTIEDGDGLQTLKDWLFTEVADDNDIVVDEMQEEFSDYFEEEEKRLGECEGSELYKENIKHLETGIKKLKTPEGAKYMQVGEKKQKITDGIRPCWYGGHKDNQNLPHGEGMLKYENKDVFTGIFQHGVLNRTGRFMRSKENCLATHGTWVNGLMEGEMKVEQHCGGWIEGYWVKGVPHGFQREFGAIDVNSNDMDHNKHMLKFVGRYYRGIRRGFCWQGCFGGGFICGVVDKEDGSFSGNDIAYIYPDFKTAMKGQFHNEQLVSGQMCEVVGSILEHGIRIPIFSQPSGPTYTYESPSRKVIAKNTMIPDQWESEKVYVKESLLPQGGEGLFAKNDIPKKNLLCLFNGVRLNAASLYAKLGESDYRIRLNADIDLDIPNGFHKLSQYCATLGHKANHSFSPNAEWALVEHPRFGLIRGISSQIPIKKDEEILINYQMNLADAPDWYRVVWLRHQREYKKMDDAAIQRIVARYEENTGKRFVYPDEEDFVVPEPKGIDDVDDDEEVNKGVAQLELPHADIIEEMDKAKGLFKLKEKCKDNEAEPRFTELPTCDDI